MRILVADDDRQFSQLACQILVASGHQALPAYDGASAMMAAILDIERVSDVSALPLAAAD